MSDLKKCANLSPEEITDLWGAWQNSVERGMFLKRLEAQTGDVNPVSAWCRANGYDITSVTMWLRRNVVMETGAPAPNGKLQRTLHPDTSEPKPVVAGPAMPGGLISKPRGRPPSGKVWVPGIGYRDMSKAERDAIKAASPPKRKAAAERRQSYSAPRSVRNVAPPAWMKHFEDKSDLAASKSLKPHASRNPHSLEADDNSIAFAKAQRLADARVEACQQSLSKACDDAKFSEMLRLAQAKFCSSVCCRREGVVRWHRAASGEIKRIRPRHTALCLLAATEISNHVAGEEPLVLLDTASQQTHKLAEAAGIGLAAAMVVQRAGFAERFFEETVRKRITWEEFLSGLRCTGKKGFDPLAEIFMVLDSLEDLRAMSEVCHAWYIAAAASPAWAILLTKKVARPLLTQQLNAGVVGSALCSTILGTIQRRRRGVPITKHEVCSVNHMDASALNIDKSSKITGVDIVSGVSSSLLVVRDCAADQGSRFELYRIDRGAASQPESVVTSPRRCTSVKLWDGGPEHGIMIVSIDTENCLNLWSTVDATLHRTLCSAGSGARLMTIVDDVLSVVASRNDDSSEDEIIRWNLRSGVTLLHVVHTNLVGVTLFADGGFEGSRDDSVVAVAAAAHDGIPTLVKILYPKNLPLSVTGRLPSERRLLHLDIVDKALVTVDSTSCICTWRLTDLSTPLSVLDCSSTFAVPRYLNIEGPFCGFHQESRWIEEWSLSGIIHSPGQTMVIGEISTPSGPKLCATVLTYTDRLSGAVRKPPEQSARMLLMEKLPIGYHVCSNLGWTVCVGSGGGGVALQFVDESSENLQDPLRQSTKRAKTEREDRLS